MNKLLYTLSLLCFFFLNSVISQTVSISGKVVRHNGDPVEGVTVTCTNASPVTSAVDGSFTFTDLPEGADYEINGTFETDVFEGITILDVLFARNMIIVPGLDFSDFQLFAGDLSNSGSFSTYDLVQMSKASLKIDGGLPGTYWYFFDQESNFPILQAGIFLENVTEDVGGLELVATKSGDVAIDSDHLPPPPDAPEPQFYVPELSAISGEEISLEIRVNDFRDIAGFQHDLSWDPAVFEFVELEDNIITDLGFNEDFLDVGHFPISGALIDNAINMDLDDGDLLYSIKFKALTDISSILGVVEFSETVIPGQTVYRDEDGALFLLEDSFETAVFTSTTGISGLETFNISPNLTQNEAFVDIKFGQVENGNLYLYDFSGKLIRTWRFNGRYIQKTISLEGLPKGTYALKLRTNNGVATKRIVKY